LCRHDANLGQEYNYRMIVIAGAGIGGLALGCALRRAGRRFVILERAPALAPVGAGITLSANALAALEHLGLREAALSAGHEMGEAIICDRRGRVLVALGSKLKKVLRTGAPVDRESIGPTLGLARARLQDVLLAGIGQAVETGWEVAGFSLQSGGVTVTSTDGRRVEGELLVGADGLRSAVRRVHRGEEPLRYAGYTSWRALVDFDLPNPERMSESWGPGARFGIVPIGGGRVYWFAVADAPEAERDADDPRAALRARFAAWHAPIERLIDATRPDQILRADIYDRPPIDHWSEDRVVLMGDAAHPMTPNLGQGGGQAIEDAVVLADALTHEPTMEGALARYEARRLPRANAFVVRSQRMGRLAHVRGAPLLWLRDRALRMIPKRLAARSLARQLEFRV
jgi:2-polyprenyl-6-methoxyphenol hydroxylase-like FAD-dependent oxidoreductase